jgi:hypothetical protein
MQTLATVVKTGRTSIHFVLPDGQKAVKIGIGTGDLDLAIQRFESFRRVTEKVLVDIVDELEPGIFLVE